MKVKTNTVPFQPIELSITIESQSELDAFYQLGNYGGPISSHLNDLVVGGVDKMLSRMLETAFFDPLEARVSQK